MRISTHAITTDTIQAIQVRATATPLNTTWHNGQPLLFCEHTGGEATRLLNVRVFNDATGDVDTTGMLYLGTFTEEYGHLWHVYTD